MKRRELLKFAGVAAGTGLASPAIAQGKRKLTMATDWPAGPGLLASAQRLAKTISSSSEERLTVEVFASGELVRSFETFDAVEAGVADMFHTHLGYYGRKARAFDFYSGLPFGFTAKELFAWIHFGGGQELWDDLGARFGIKPLACCSTGSQMGGWYLNEIRSVEDFRGLRYRMAGPGAEVYRRLGAAVVLLPPADIIPALESGAIDAAEWSGPWLDTDMGLDRIASYYYYPGWHEPGGIITLGISRNIWDDLAETDRTLVETAAAAEYATSLAEFDARNATALHTLRVGKKVSMRRFSNEILAKLEAVSKDVVAESGAGDPLAARIYESYNTFLDEIRDWSAVTEGAYLSFRATSR
jgi:TRAP-type mannitol/chloroaromatic compound transport system substrate-binding protein